MSAGCIRRTAGFASIVLVICAAYALGSGSVSVVRVAGGSMAPALWPGDVCLVTRAADAHVKDVVLFTQTGHKSRVLHRVRSVETSGVVTQGDANPVPDRETVAWRDLRGRVSLVLPVGRAVHVWQVAAGR